MVAMRSQVGFTLLELLIAMTLMGIVLVLLYSGLRLGMRSWDAGEQRVEDVNEIRLVEDFIRRQLRQSISVYRQDETQGRVVVFSGESQRITLVAPLLNHLGLGGLYLIQLQVVASDGMEQLQMRWRPYRPGDDRDDPSITEQTILLDDIVNVQWAYYGSPANDQQPQWHAQWQDSSQRPVLVRLDLNIHGTPWPSLVAALSD